MKTIREESKKSKAIHTIAHGSEGNIMFDGNNIDGFAYCDLLPDSLETVSFSVCRSGAISQHELYPIEHIGWVHKMLLKKTKRVFTHTWDLGQSASRQFAVNYYQNNDNYIEMKKFKPAEYGGYMIWGL